MMDPKDRERITAIVSNALELLPRQLPPDEEKAEQDWLDDQAQADWRQDAFNTYHHLGSEYLNATRGGEQTSRDLHTFCQGFKSAVEAMATLGEVSADMTDRLEALYHRLRDFPEASRCEQGMHLKRDAYVAFLELRKLIENEMLPALARK